MAAVERFYPVYTEGVQVRVLAPGDPACIEVVADRPASALPADEYRASDRRGRSILP
jgi:hypothetical protein